MTEQDEIRRLKELIAKQQLQLAEKDEIIRKQNIRIENMTQVLLHAKKKIFGRSSEVTAPMKGQMFLFESTAELAKSKRLIDRRRPQYKHPITECSTLDTFTSIFKLA